MKKLIIITTIILVATTLILKTGCGVGNEVVEPTYEELQAVQSETMQLLDELGLFCDTDINIQENQVEVYVTDSKLFNETLREVNAQLPAHVVAIVIYEPLYEIPFEVNPDPSIHFPQLKMRSGSFMQVSMVGELILENSYLCVGDTVIIWQPDYFLNNDNGTIEILDRNGKVVARVGEEIVMGGGGIPIEYVNRLIREPFPEDCSGPFFLQGSETRLSLNFSSDLFSIEIIPFEEHDFYFIRKKPLLDEMAPQRTVITGRLVASRDTTLLRYPHIFVDEKPDENKTSVTYTTLWPADCEVRVENGVFELVNGSGRVILRDGEEAELEGSVFYGISSDVARRLFDELPGGLFQPYLIVNRVLGSQE